MIKFFRNIRQNLLYEEKPPNILNMPFGEKVPAEYSIN